MIHWTHIRKAVQDAGGTWTTREEGEAFLAGLNVVVAEETLFDRNKPYGTVHGYDARFPDAAYLQGGAYFDKRGKKVG